MRVIDLALKDLTQIVRDWKTAFFLLIMPIPLTLLFGSFFGGGGAGEQDPRLPVGYLDRDQGQLSSYLLDLLGNSAVIRLEVVAEGEDLEKRVADDDWIASLVVPVDYSDAVLAGEAPQLHIILDINTAVGSTAQAEIQFAVNRLFNAVQTAQISTQVHEEIQAFTDETARQAFFDAAVERTLEAWENPPVVLAMTQTGEAERDDPFSTNVYAQYSPGMMAQFAIAGLIGAAEVLVVERKTRALQRLLTTTISRVEILLGHYLAIFVMIYVQFAILIIFGHLFLDLAYLSQPVATLLISVGAALCAASMGLLIGTIARNEDQVVILTMIPMFVFSGLGGAWVPLETTPETVQFIGHLTPVAWMMDGYKNILIRGQGLEAALLPAGVLIAFGLLCFGLAVWRFKFE